jgi:hypothetical protein
MNSAAEILARARELPDADRADVANTLLLSLASQDADPDQELLAHDGLRGGGLM